MGSCQYDTLTLTLTPLSLFLPEGRSANFASEPACPAPAHHEKPPTSPHDGRGRLAGDETASRVPTGDAGGLSHTSAFGRRLPEYVSVTDMKIEIKSSHAAHYNFGWSCICPGYRAQRLRRLLDPSSIKKRRALECWVGSSKYRKALYDRTRGHVTGWSLNRPALTHG
jgi:hypothetical protein